MATLYKRGKVWYSKLKISGKQVRRPLSRDRRMAENKLADLIKQRDSARHGHALQDVAFQTFRTEYLAVAKKEKKPKTWTTDERAFNNLEKTLPISRLHQVNPALLDRLKSKWVAAGRGVHVINREVRALKTAFRKAEMWGYIQKQEWRQVAYIKTPKGRLRFFLVDELKKLKGVCRGSWKTILYLGARVGLRREEMRWLEWTDVDFENSKIHIAPKEGWTPKDYERRFIPMTEVLKLYLLDLYKSHKENWVLMDQNGRPTLGAMTTYFRRLVKKALGSKATGSVHTLRHTYASHYVQNGGDIYQLMHYLGHAKIETTMIYAHLKPDAQDKTLARMPTF